MSDWVQAAMKGMAYSLLAVLGVLLVSFYSLIYGNFINVSKYCMYSMIS